MSFTRLVGPVSVLLGVACWLGWGVAPARAQSALGTAAQVPTPAAPQPAVKKPPLPPHHAPGKPRVPPVVQAQKSPHAQRPNQKPAAPAAPAAPAPATAPPAPAAASITPERPADAPKGGATGLPLPRFAALRSDEVNLRTGPGTRYPIDWLYRRRDLPVEIEREFEVWRLVSDPDGVKGWVHAATLTGRRSFIVRGAEATLRQSASDTAAAVAILKPGVVGRIRGCAAGAAWCELQVGDYRGFLQRDQFWGTYAGEAVN